MCVAALDVRNLIDDDENTPQLKKLSWIEIATRSGGLTVEHLYACTVTTKQTEGDRFVLKFEFSIAFQKPRRASQRINSQRNSLKVLFCLWSQKFTQNQLWQEMFWWAWEMHSVRCYVLKRNLGLILDQKRLDEQEQEPEQEQVCMSCEGVLELDKCSIDNKTTKDSYILSKKCIERVRRS